MRMAVIASLILREMERSGVRNKSFVSCWVRVDAPRIFLPEVTLSRMALGMAQTFMPQWLKNSRSSMAITAW